jgi:hypothetical protein
MRGAPLVAVSALLCVMPAWPAAEQAGAPKLSRGERTAMQSIVAAVDRAAAAPDVAPIDGPLHVLRASDGSHYVAFSVIALAGIPANQPGVVYVRLATRPAGGGAVAERSMVAEWLAGRNNAPLKRERGIAINEMPVFGAGAAANTGNVAGTSGRGVASQNLQLLEMERERARERREAQDRERKAELEGEKGVRSPNPVLPFEDFDLHATTTADKSGIPMLRRSLTAGPGDYDLLLGWADASAKDPAASVRVFKRPLQLPIASTTTFALSGVIVADEVSVRDAPVAADQQTRNPYSIGRTHIVPARDHSLTTDERLALVVQVINASAAPDGKPDVAVGFRIQRRTPNGHEQVGTLSPQLFNRTTLPEDFSASLGHPIFAAVAVPLGTFRRGEYRVDVMADDRLGGVSATNSMAFDIVSTPSALLRDAPPLALAFRREDALQPALLEAITNRIRPPAPSTALAAALDAARQRRFIDLVREDAVSADEQGARVLLRGLALYALGDTPASLAVPVRQAAALSAPPAAVQAVVGATRALEGNDREAIAAWQAAIDAGLDASVLTSLLADAHMRLGNQARVVELATASLAAQPGDAAMTRRLAAAHMAGNRLDEAVRVLEDHLRATPADVDAQWLLLQALFTGAARAQGPGADQAGRDRIREIAERYAQAGGKNAALATEWAASVK